MSKFRFSFKLAAVLMAIAVIGCGCINVDYVGQSFPALPEDAPVVVFTPESPMPPEEYRAIGRVFVTAPDGRGIGDVREELIKLAREHGAEAVNIVECKRVSIGMNAADNSNGWNPSWNHDDRNAGGAFIYSNSFGEADELAAPNQRFYELQVKALLAVTNERFKTMEALYREQRARLEASAPAPDAVAATPEQAMDQSIHSRDLAPVTEAEAAPAAERTPVQVELNDSRNPVNL